MASFPRVTSQLPGGRLITLDHFHHGRGSILSFLEDTFTLGMDLPSLMQCFFQNSHPWTYRLPSWSSHTIASDQGTLITANEVWQWAPAHGIHWSYSVPRRPEAAVVIEWWNGLLKDSVTVTARWQSLADLGQGSPIYGAVFLKVRNQGVEMGGPPLTIAPSDPQRHFCFLLCLCFAGLKVLIPLGDTTMSPLNWKLRLLLIHFGFLIPVNQQAKKELPCGLG